VVRRRRGRGAPSYYRVFCERGGNAGLAPLSETDALLAGYAQAAQCARPTLVVQHHHTYYYLPSIPLPAPHRDLLQRLGEHAKHGQVDQDGWPLAQRIYERMGITLSVVSSPPQQD
jgi:hypothetical protein